MAPQNISYFLEFFTRVDDKVPTLVLQLASGALMEIHKTCSLFERLYAFIKKTMPDQLFLGMKGLSKDFPVVG